MSDSLMDNFFPKCKNCDTELGKYSSATFCYNCTQKNYEKINPNWKNSHPCEMCEKKKEIGACETHGEPVYEVCNRCFNNMVKLFEESK